MLPYFPVNVLEGETNFGYMKPMMAYTFLEGFTTKLYQGAEQR